MKDEKNGRVNSSKRKPNSANISNAFAEANLRNIVIQNIEFNVHNAGCGNIQVLIYSECLQSERPKSEQCQNRDTFSVWISDVEVA